MSETIGYRIALDNTQYVRGMREAQQEVRGLTVQSRSSNLGALSGELQLASGSMSTFTAGTSEARGGLMELTQSMQAGKGALGAVGTAFIGVTAVVGTFVVATQASLAVLSNYAPFDSMVRGLTTLEGSISGAQNRIETLRDVAKVPGLGFQEAVKADIRLRAVGLSAEQSESALRSFGNALATVGGSKADLDGVILGLSQIAAKGQISAEEINQIAERVPQVRRAMQDAFGTADSEALQKMGVDATQFISGLVAELGKLPAVTGGAQNTLDNYSDSWAALKIQASEFGATMATTWIQDVTRSFDQARSDLRSLKDLFVGGDLSETDVSARNRETAREAERAARRQAHDENVANAAAAAQNEVRLHNDNLAYWEEKQAERTAALKEQTAARETIEKQALARIAANAEKFQVASLSPEANIQRKIQNIEAAGPSTVADANATKDVLVADAILARVAEIATLKQQLTTYQDAAAAKARSEAESAERKAKAEASALKSRQAAADTFAKEDAILSARAAGNDRLVKQLERQAAVEETKQRLIATQGLTAEQAAIAAERRQKLLEAAGGQDGNRRSKIFTLSQEEQEARRQDRLAQIEKTRADRWNNIGIVRQAAGAAIEAAPAVAKDHTEAVSRKLDRLAAIDEKLGNLKIA